jgi:hypothetical protein
MIVTSQCEAKLFLTESSVMIPSVRNFKISIFATSVPLQIMVYYVEEAMLLQAPFHM